MIIRGQEDIFGDDEYVYDIDRGGGFRGMYLAPISLICIH